MNDTFSNNDDNCASSNEDNLVSFINQLRANSGCSRPALARSYVSITVIYCVILGKTKP